MYYNLCITIRNTEPQTMLPMRKIKLPIAALSILLLAAFCTEKLPKYFSELLHRAKMTFENTTDMVEATPIENRQMNYEYALINSNKDFEVRYAIRPLDELIKTHDEHEKNKKPGDIYIHPNKFYSALFETTVLNISGGQFPEPSMFDSDAVKREFNADWGATVLVEVGEEFGQDYKYCLVVAIHKESIADAYYFYLSDKRETITANMDKLFHSLRFK